MGEPNVKLQSRYQLFIGGEWRDALDGGVFQTTCPANGQVLAGCAQATREDVDLAVAAAARCLRPPALRPSAYWSWPG